MKRRLFVALAGVAVLAVFGLRVREEEALIAAGDDVLLALAPVDPRSLLQGDYMRLAWAIERDAVHLPDGETAVVLALDERRVATFRRPLTAGAPGPGERAFAVGRAEDGDGIVIEPHSFLFQEGRAEAYAAARFGIFRVDPNGRHLLVGLADADGRRIDPR